MVFGNKDSSHGDATANLFGKYFSSAYFADEHNISDYSQKSLPCQ